MWLLALISTAIAGPTGFYHPADLAAESTRFAEANRAAADAYEEVSRTSVQLARALRDYREGLDLLGDDAPDSEYERLEELERAFNRQRAKAQAFADTLIEDFDGEFTAARDRALESLDAEVVECVREIPDGPQVPGMGQRTRPNPECAGEDLNAALAAEIDADPELEAALKEILAIPWPEVELESEAMDPVGGGDRTIQVRELIRTGAGDRLTEIDREDDQARLPFQAAIEQGASPDQLEAQVVAARKVTADTARKRAEVAAPVLEASDKVLSKWASKGQPTTGWCANPPVLGGCAGDDATDQLVPALLDERKVDKALP